MSPYLQIYLTMQYHLVINVAVFYIYIEQLVSYQSLFQAKLTVAVLILSVVHPSSFLIIS